MAIISLGVTSYKFAYPILEAITYIIRSNSFKIFPNYSYACSPIFNLFLMDFSMLLCLVFEIVSMLRQSKSKNSFKNNIVDFFSKYKNNPSNIFFLILLAILDFYVHFLIHSYFI